MQESNDPGVQFGPGGEQWWQIPAGAMLVSGDGLNVGTIQRVGTSYLHATDAATGADNLLIPLQTIVGYDAQTNIVHLSVLAQAVTSMTGAPPANDPLSLNAAAVGTPYVPTVQTPVRSFAIPLREQFLQVTTLPTVVKNVTVRRERVGGTVSVTETVRRETAHVEENDHPAIHNTRGSLSG